MPFRFFRLALATLVYLLPTMALAVARSRRPRAAHRLARPAGRAPVFAERSAVSADLSGKTRDIASFMLSWRMLGKAIWFSLIVTLLFGLAIGGSRLASAPKETLSQPPAEQDGTWFELHKGNSGHAPKDPYQVPKGGY